MKTIRYKGIDIYLHKHATDGFTLSHGTVKMRYIGYTQKEAVTRFILLIEGK